MLAIDQSHLDIITMLLRLLFAGLVVITVYFAIRSTLLYRKSQALFKEAPTERTYSVGNDKDQPFVYVALGDSTAAGVGVAEKSGTYAYKIAEKKASEGKYVQVINLGVSGSRASNMLEDQVSRVAALKPNLITVTIGANDATHFTSLKEYEQSLSQILGTLRDSGGTVLFATTPRMQPVPALPPPFAYFVNKRAQEQNEALRRMASNSSIRIVDLFNDGVLDYKKDPALYAPDLFHPSAKGYGVWATTFISQLPPL
jgi:lysophospholipase L1-like esterase